MLFFPAVFFSVPPSRFFVSCLPGFFFPHVFCRCVFSGAVEPLQAERWRYPQEVCQDGRPDRNAFESLGLPAAATAPAAATTAATIRRGMRQPTLTLSSSLLCCAPLERFMTLFAAECTTPWFSLRVNRKRASGRTISGVKVFPEPTQVLVLRSIYLEDRSCETDVSEKSLGDLPSTSNLSDIETIPLFDKSAREKCSHSCANSRTVTVTPPRARS